MAKMSEEQKILNAMFREKSEGEMCHTVSSLMRRSNLPSLAVNRGLHGLYIRKMVECIDGSIHRSQRGRPTTYWYPVSTLEWGRVTDPVTGEPATGAQPTATPNPDVDLIIDTITSVDKTINWEQDTPTGKLARAAGPDFAQLRTDLESVRGEHWTAQVPFISKAVHARVRWAFDYSSDPRHGLRIAEEDLLALIDLEPLNLPEYAPLAKKALHRLRYPWYPEYWAIGGLRISKKAKSERRYYVRRRDNEFTKSDEWLFHARLPMIQRLALERGGSAHRAAWAIANAFMDVVNTEEDYELPEGFERSFMKRSLAYTPMAPVNFDVNVFTHDTETLEAVQPLPGFHEIVREALPNFEGEDDRTPDQIAHECQTMAGSIFWVLGKWREREGLFYPEWKTEPEAFARRLSEFRDLGIPLDSMQRRLSAP